MRYYFKVIFLLLALFDFFKVSAQDMTQVIEKDYAPPPHLYKQSKKLLNGTWYLVASNCDEIVKSDRDTVMLVFSNFKIKNDRMTFDESLIYYKNKQRKVQRASNLQRTQIQLNFIWTGKGDFQWANRKWRVIASDSEGQWMVVHFYKTKKKYNGIAVIVRDRNMPESELQEIITYIAKSYLEIPLQSLRK